MQPNEIVTVIKHRWFPLCSDINTQWYDTYSWWKCSNCGKETEHTKKRNVPEPSVEGCLAKTEKSIYPLSSI